MSGPGGYLGADVRDGFLLAAEMEGGKLGGVPVQVLVEDDGFKPGQGKQIADKFLKSENIKLITGIVFSTMLGANVLVEKVFSWPGVASYALDALLSADYAPVQAFVLLMALIFVGVNVLIDILYGIADPRVSVE